MWLATHQKDCILRFVAIGLGVLELPVHLTRYETWDLLVGLTVEMLIEMYGFCQSKEPLNYDGDYCEIMRGFSRNMAPTMLHGSVFSVKVVK